MRFRDPSDIRTPSCLSQLREERQLLGLGKHLPCPPSPRLRWAGRTTIWRMVRKLFLLTVCASASLAVTQAQPSPSFDVLIQNGRVMDGSGNPWIRASVGIRGGRIAA